MKITILTICKDLHVIKDSICIQSPNGYKTVTYNTVSDGENAVESLANGVKLALIKHMSGEAIFRPIFNQSTFSGQT